MPKKRRKLNKEMESNISTGSRTVELIQAKINDIDEDDIQEEYNAAFHNIKITFLTLVSLYNDYGFNDESQDTFDKYISLLKSFEKDYEL
tara:strand:- start:262 stop:531 length:270 start_codon:yes stop_codon:yes gene_type:complete